MMLVVDCMVEYGNRRRQPPAPDHNARTRVMASRYSTLPSVDAIRSAFDYAPETGVLTWRFHPAWPPHLNARWVGCEAGAIFRSPKGRLYRRIGWAGRAYMAHRLAWVHFHGTQPAAQIDHRNNDGLDNRIDNLREATHGENRMNARTSRNNRLGIKGVTPFRNGFRAAIRAYGKRIWLGDFPTAEEAASAYATAARRYHGTFARTE